MNASDGPIYLDRALVDYILKGNKPVPCQMLTGTIDCHRRAQNMEPNGSIENPSGGGVGSGSRKQGGTIPIKPLPKYQKGSKFAVHAPEYNGQVFKEPVHDPLSSSVKISDAINAEDF